MYGNPSQPCIIIKATLVQVGSVFQGMRVLFKKGNTLLSKGITWVLIAPILSLNIFEKVKIVMKAGTAQGSRKITPKMRFPLMKGWLAIIAVKIPITICKVEAHKAQMMVQDRTEPKAERKVLRLQMLLKFVKPTQSSSFVGGRCLKS